MSDTMRSARVQCIEHFASHLCGIQLPKTKNEIDGVLTYLGTIACVLMSAVCHIILAATDICNRVI